MPQNLNKEGTRNANITAIMPTMERIPAARYCYQRPRHLVFGSVADTDLKHHPPTANASTVPRGMMVMGQTGPQNISLNGMQRIDTLGDHTDPSVITDKSTEDEESQIQHLQEQLAKVKLELDLAKEAAELAARSQAHAVAQAAIVSKENEVLKRRLNFNLLEKNGALRRRLELLNKHDGIQKRLRLNDRTNEPKGATQNSQADAFTNSTAALEGKEVLKKESVLELWKDNNGDSKIDDKGRGKKNAFHMGDDCPNSYASPTEAMPNTFEYASGGNDLDSEDEIFGELLYRSSRTAKARNTGKPTTIPSVSTLLDSNNAAKEGNYQEDTARSKAVPFSTKYSNTKQVKDSSRRILATALVDDACEPTRARKRVADRKNNGAKMSAVAPSSVPLSRNDGCGSIDGMASGRTNSLSLLAESRCRKRIYSDNNRANPCTPSQLPRLCLKTARSVRVGNQHGAMLTSGHIIIINPKYRTRGNSKASKHLLLTPVKQKKGGRIMCKFTPIFFRKRSKKIGNSPKWSPPPSYSVADEQKKADGGAMFTGDGHDRTTPYVTYRYQHYDPRSHTEIMRVH